MFDKWYNFKDVKPSFNTDTPNTDHYCSDLILFCIDNDRLFLGYYLKERLGNKWTESIEIPIFNHIVFNTHGDEIERNGCLYPPSFALYDIKWCNFNKDSVIKNIFDSEKESK